MRVFNSPAALGEDPTATTPFVPLGKPAVLACGATVSKKLVSSLPAVLQTLQDTLCSRVRYT